MINLFTKTRKKKFSIIITCIILLKRLLQKFSTILLYTISRKMLFKIQTTETRSYTISVHKQTIKTLMNINTDNIRSFLNSIRTGIKEFHLPRDDGKSEFIINGNKK